MTRALGQSLLLLAVIVVASGCLDSEADAPRPSNDTPAQTPNPTTAARPSSTPAPAGTSPATAGATVAATAVPASSSTPPVTWNALGATDLTFSLSGGIAGFARRLSIDASARVRAEDQRTSRVRESTLAPADAATLSSLLQNSAIDSQATEQKSPCADCFDYTLTLVGGTKSQTITANSVGLDARLRPLVEWLTAWQQRELE